MKEFNQNRFDQNSNETSPKMRRLKISRQILRASFQLTFNNNRNSINFAFYRRWAVFT